MTAYYNEIDPYAAQWLRNLIAAGHIAPGVVDERSIEDIRPDDLRGYTQVHMFAGIGVWSYALRLAGVDDSTRIWTGSCPCQPFSAAGKGDGFADERHLWPAWLHLISQCEPPRILGEQVASKDAEPWLDLVSADLEGLGYAFGALAFPSAGVGAPHIRDRTYFLADADHARSQGRRRVRERAAERAPWPSCVAGIGADAAPSVSSELANADSAYSKKECKSDDAKCEQWQAVGRGSILSAGAGAGSGISSGCSGIGIAVEMAGMDRSSPTNGFWRDADWLLCRDEKFRPVEPGTFPLVDGAPSRVGRLRAYGNAINAYQAAEFIGATLNV